MYYFRWQTIHRLARDRIGELASFVPSDLGRTHKIICFAFMLSNVLMEADPNPNPSYIAMGGCTHARTHARRLSDRLSYYSRLLGGGGMIDCPDRTEQANVTRVYLASPYIE